jgi:hypothetical protein
VSDNLLPDSSTAFSPEDSVDNENDSARTEFETDTPPPLNTSPAIIEK